MAIEEFQQEMSDFHATENACEALCTFIDNAHAALTDRPDDAQIGFWSWDSQSPDQTHMSSYIPGELALALLNVARGSIEQRLLNLGAERAGIERILRGIESARG